MSQGAAPPKSLRSRNRRFKRFVRDVRSWTPPTMPERLIEVAAKLASPLGSTQFFQSAGLNLSDAFA